MNNPVVYHINALVHRHPSGQAHHPTLELNARIRRAHVPSWSTPPVSMYPGVYNLLYWRKNEIAASDFTLFGHSLCSDAQ